MKTRPRRKADYVKAIRINISLSPDLDRRKGELFVKFAFNGLSDYVQARMRKDLGLDLAA